jgi:hypothetical protein
VLFDLRDAGGTHVDILQLAKDAANLSPAAIFVLIIVAILRNKIVLPRELEERDRIIAELKKERDEYKQLTFQALHVGERAVHAAEENK